MRTKRERKEKKGKNKFEVEGEQYMIAVGARGTKKQQREQVPRLCLFKPRCKGEKQGARCDRIECEMQGRIEPMFEWEEE